MSNIAVGNMNELKTNYMKHYYYLALLLLLIVCSKDADAKPKGPNDPQSETAVNTNISEALVNPNATAEAQALYQKMCRVYSKKAISGVVADIDWNTREADNVHKWTGKWPVINVFDFINIHASKDVNANGWLNYSDMTPVTQWHQMGGVVGCMWHWQVKANNGTDMTCSPGTKPTSQLINCPHFIVHRVVVQVAQQIDFHSDSFVIVVCLWGEANINGISIKQGETILVPACENILYIFGNATFLTATM